MIDSLLIHHQFIIFGRLSHNSQTSISLLAKANMYTQTRNQRCTSFDWNLESINTSRKKENSNSEMRPNPLNSLVELGNKTERNQTQHSNVPILYTSTHNCRSIHPQRSWIYSFSFDVCMQRSLVCHVRRRRHFGTCWALRAHAAVDSRLTMLSQQSTLTSPSREPFQGRFAQSPVNDCHLTVRWLNAGSHVMHFQEGVDNRNYIYIAKNVIVAAFFVDACDLVFVDQTQRSTHTCGRVDYKCRLNKQHNYWRLGAMSLSVRVTVCGLFLPTID